MQDLKINPNSLKTCYGFGLLQSWFMYYSENFLNEMEWRKGDELIQYAKDNNIELEGYDLIKHKDGIALCFLFDKNNVDTYIEPFLNVKIEKPLDGAVFTIKFINRFQYVNLVEENGVLVFKRTVSCDDRFQDIDINIKNEQLYLSWIVDRLNESFCKRGVKCPTRKNPNIEHISCKQYEIHDNWDYGELRDAFKHSKEE